MVCRGAALDAAGPLFCRPSDYLLSASGQRCPWAQRTFGDRDVARESDLHYRESVLILPPPPTAAGYEVVFRLQSTSTLILLASLSSPQEFVQRATADTAFWSFYFGLAAVASGVALWLALALRRRLLWGSVFSRSIIRWWPPARLPGVVLRPRRAALPGFYDQ